MLLVTYGTMKIEVVCGIVQQNLTTKKHGTLHNRNV